MKPFIRICDSSLLRRSVIVLCGEKKALERLFFDPKGPFKSLDVKHPAHRKTWDYFAKVWDEHVEYPSEDVGGVPSTGFAFSYGGDVYLVLTEWNKSRFIHEAFHATHAILRIIGTDDEELGAYFIEWLHDCLCGKETR